MKKKKKKTGRGERAHERVNLSGEKSNNDKCGESEGVMKWSTGASKQDVTKRGALER